MRFKVDENLPREVTDLLLQRGHDACSIADQNLTGETDSAIAAVCRVEQRVVVTLDLGFADIRSYPPQHAAGRIVLRPHRQGIADLVFIVRRLLEVREWRPLLGRGWVVDDQRVRIRGSSSDSAVNPDNN